MFSNGPLHNRVPGCILFSTGDVQRNCELGRGRERRVVAVGGTCSAGSSGLTAQLACEHLGIAIGAGFHGAGLVRVLPEWEAVPAHVFAVTPVQLIPAELGKFIELMRAHFEESMAREKPQSCKSFFSGVLAVPTTYFRFDALLLQLDNGDIVVEGGAQGTSSDVVTEDARWLTT